MNVELRDVDETNFRAVLDLKVAAGQEGFVAPNVRSLAQCYVYGHLIPNAVFSGDELVGFALYCRDRESGQYWIARLMIDAAHQGKGLGKAAANALIDKMKILPGCREIFLSFVPGNDRAAALYRSIGFRPTGETDESGEIIMRYSVQQVLTVV